MHVLELQLTSAGLGGGGSWVGADTGGGSADDNGCTGGGGMVAGAGRPGGGMAAPAGLGGGGSIGSGSLRLPNSTCMAQASRSGAGRMRPACTAVGGCAAVTARHNTQYPTGRQPQKGTDLKDSDL